MKSGAKKILRNIIFRYYRLIDTLGFDNSPKTPVNFIVEKADWAIQWVGKYIYENITTNYPNFIQITTNPAPIKNSIIHFGSQYQWLLWEQYIADNNNVVVSFFHGKRSDGESAKKHIDNFLLTVPKISRIVTGAELIKNRLINWGVDSNKIIKIPIGCDTTYFIPPTIKQKQAARIKLAVPDKAISIGSFQKDGVGWGDGTVPKLIKGPDIFISVVKELKKHIPIFILLTGPARGYVKNELEKNNIPYHHSYLNNYKEILNFYYALDLYLVTSREEGGPMALMESMASHVPVVSTKVGQAEDLIEDKITGGLVDIDDVQSICERVLHYINLDSNIKKAQLTMARDKVIDGYDWKFVANQHYKKVYKPLINNN